MSRSPDPTLSDLAEALQGEGTAGEWDESTQSLAGVQFELGALGAALELASRHPIEEAALLHAEILAFCGCEDEALGLACDAYDSGCARCDLVRARVATARGDWELSAAYAVAACRDHGLRPRAACLAARALLELGRPHEALVHLDARLMEGAVDNLECRWLLKRISGATPDALLTEVHDRGAFRLLADAWTDVSRDSIAQGRDSEARSAAMRALEIWDDLATTLPPSFRPAFWSDVRRQSVRDCVKQAKPKSAGAHDASLSPLLHNLRLLTAERDLDRLLGAITDGAVSLSGAERGFVLLSDAQGALEPATIRSVESRLGHETAAFSRSIAETVLIDGEPLVTMDAAEDPRLQDYLSVHRLMLKSVACLPIAAYGRTRGVLYLEHRRARDRFSNTDVSLLRAYADQAAIALETSELLDRLARQDEALDRANDALHAANERLEQRARHQVSAPERGFPADSEGLMTGERRGLVGASRVMRRLWHRLERVAARDVPVAVTGESGTGKELVAQAIHQKSMRDQGPFISVSCGAIPDGLLESELFGHVQGAFTGATRARPGIFVAADGGTLFIDEVEDMPQRMQLDLLRVLQVRRVRPVGGSAEIPIDVRLITASKSPLSALVEEGKLREDLYYRLAVVELPVPPLRHRREDIPLLCEHFLVRIAERRCEPKKALSRHALQRLCRHDFPGNVRELEHLLANATVFANGDTIDLEDLAIEEEGEGAREARARLESLEDFKAAERQRILDTLNAHGWNRAKAARAMGMARRTFYRRLKQHNIRLEKR